MGSPVFSVIIPAHNNAEFLKDSIPSVLNQTYPNFELIIVNDASPDHTPEVVSKFIDPRIKYISHEKNQGLSAARNTGIRASTGDYIALLDGDDLFHPEKLAAHAEFFDKNPDIGVTYNARFELNHSSRTIRELWRPPIQVGLAELVMGFPFGPSDMVIEREWAFKVNLFDESHTYVGEDLDINCRLAIAGCKFHSVDRPLNYRWYHSGRVLKNLRSCVEDTIRPLCAIFADPRCPAEVLNKRDVAYATHFLLWSAVAFSQDDTNIGQELCLDAVHLNPSFLTGQPSQLMNTMISFSILDESLDHASLLRRMFNQLPIEVALPTALQDWAVAQGYLIRGTRAIMWGRNEDGEEHFQRAETLGAKLDDHFLIRLSSQLLSYEAEFGCEAADDVLSKLVLYLEKLGNRIEMRFLKGHISINRAFQNYRAGKYESVPKDVFIALANKPGYVKNPGVLSILVHSMIGKRSGMMFNSRGK